MSVNGGVCIYYFLGILLLTLRYSIRYDALFDKNSFHSKIV